MYSFSGQSYRDFASRRKLSFALYDFVVADSGVTELIFSGSGESLGFTFDDGRVYDPEGRYFSSYEYNVPFALSGNIDTGFYQYYYVPKWPLPIGESMGTPWSKDLVANRTPKSSWPIQRIYANTWHKDINGVIDPSLGSPVNSGIITLGFDSLSYDYSFTVTGTEIVSNEGLELLPEGSYFTLRELITGYINNNDLSETSITMNNVIISGGSDAEKFKIHEFKSAPTSGGGQGKIVLRNIYGDQGLFSVNVASSTNLNEMITGVIDSDIIQLNNIFGVENPIQRTVSLSSDDTSAPASGWLWGGTATGDPNNKVDRYTLYSTVYDTRTDNMLDRPASALLEYHSGKVGQFEITSGVSSSAGSGYLSPPSAVISGGYAASPSPDPITGVVPLLKYKAGWSSVTGVNVIHNNTIYSYPPSVLFDMDPLDTINPVTKLNAAASAVTGSGGIVTGVEMISGGTYEHIPIVSFVGGYPNGSGAVAQAVTGSGQVLSGVRLDQPAVFYSGNNVLDYGLAKSSYGISHQLPEINLVGGGGGGFSGIPDSAQYLYSGYQKTFTGSFNLWTGYSSGIVLGNVPINSEESSRLQHHWSGCYSQNNFDPMKPPFNVGYIRSGISYQNQEPVDSYIIIYDSEPDSIGLSTHVQHNNTHDHFPIVARLVAVGDEYQEDRSGILYETGIVKDYHFAKEFYLTGVARRASIPSGFGESGHQETWD